MDAILEAQRRRVWVVNHHAVIPSKDGSSGRHLHLAKELGKHGWDASLIVASTKHPSGQQALTGISRTHTSSEGGIPVRWIRTNAYTSLPERAVGMVNFALNLIMPWATAGLERPDVVVGSTVHPLAAWAGSVLARRYHVPFVFEIRDVWPDALIELGAISRDGLVARMMRALMRSLAKRSVMVIAPLPYVDRWLQEQGLEDKPFVWVSNGTAVRQTPPAPVPVRGSFTFMYMGAHGNANILDEVLNAFDDACQSRPDLDLRLRLVGEGPNKPALIEHARCLDSASRIVFEDRIPASQVMAHAAEADAMISALHDSPVYRFGIGSNKLFTYLDSGRPTVWASSAPNNPIKEAEAGICVDSDDRGALTTALIEMATLSASERSDMALNGWQHAKDIYSFAVLANKLAESLDWAVDLGKSES